MEAPAVDPHASRLSVYDIVDSALPVILASLGLLHPESPRVWFESLGLSFAAVAAPVLGGAALATVLSRHVGRRIQAPRVRPAPILREALETARCMFVVACLMAWPVTQWRLGHPLGLIWKLDETTGSAALVVLQTLAGVVVLDAWLYWKHRLLHTRWMFGFHKAHHAFRDPTPFASFAVAPVEALLTFWPLLLVCSPKIVHWAPLYFPLIVGFVILNFYLHCGVTLRWVEATLPRVLLNTSAFHNVHHARASTHFGEAMYLWDVLCGTRIKESSSPASTSRA
jgi:sterol desaturase/sphingolipid hydroxylase (fatty acid hydroxylase superfamily)